MDFSSAAPRLEAAPDIVLHGSIERRPGVYFRALISLFRQRHREWSRGAVSRELIRRLAAEGVRYHERTLKRQLAGTIVSVPPELETAAERLLMDHGFSDLRAIETALSAARLAVPRQSHEPPYLAVERILPMAQLWMHLHPESTKRSLACRLHEDLRGLGISLNVDSLQNTLAGKKRLVRPAVMDLLLGYLKAHGVEGELQALARWKEAETAVRKSMDGRAFASVERFRRLCLLWRVQSRTASSRALAARLHADLAASGIRVGLHHLQNLVNGRTRRVRRSILAALESLVRNVLPEGADLAASLAQVEGDLKHAADLAWVKADPIVVMGREYLAAHPGASLRQLAQQMAVCIRRMGYTTSANTLQPILGGWKLRTRGYVYRAMRRQLDGKSRARIPADILLSPLPVVEPESAVTRGLDPQEAAIARLAMALRSHRSRQRPTVDQFLRAARRYLPQAQSVNFLDFQAYRAERMFGIARDEARAQIVNGVRGRTGRAVNEEDGRDGGDFGGLDEEFLGMD